MKTVSESAQNTLRHEFNNSKVVFPDFGWILTEVHTYIQLLHNR